MYKTPPAIYQLRRARVYGSDCCNSEVNFVAIGFDVPHSPSFSFWCLWQLGEANEQTPQFRDHWWSLEDKCRSVVQCRSSHFHTKKIQLLVDTSVWICVKQLYWNHILGSLNEQTLHYLQFCFPRQKTKCEKTIVGKYFSNFYFQLVWKELVPFLLLLIRTQDGVK